MEHFDTVGEEVEIQQSLPSSAGDSEDDPIVTPSRPSTPASSQPNVEATSVPETQLPALDQIVPGECGKILQLQLLPPPAKDPPPAAAVKPKTHPQEKLTKFWKNFEPEYQGKITQILPESLTNHNADKKALSEPQHSSRASNSYEDARSECIRAVERIRKECEEQNVRFSDPHFDIEDDIKISNRRDCLGGLVPDIYPFTVPGDVKRVPEVFQNPCFFKDDNACDDVVQGTNSDCWFLAAISALRSNHDLLKKVCVAQERSIGVYGFVFHRDGEWHQCIIDDKLYLRAPAYDEHGVDVLGSWNVVQKQPEDLYESVFQTGSRALQFAQCSNSDETWVPLLEKAYAKAHGDYQAINAGQTGEALEDLTGGVTSEIYTTNILDIDKFWTEELSKVGKKYLFSCGLACYRNWLRNVDDTSDRAVMERAVQEKRNSGLVASHAYAILDTYTGFGKRLVKVRNPWGHTGWTGPWSNGSKEWTQGDGDWLRRLGHKFGNDGVFWMEYRDFLRKFRYLDRTRLFDSSWHQAAAWTSVQVPWSSPGYLETKFTITVPCDSPSVIVLSQLDDRYFCGLEGKWDYKLHFRVQKDGAEPDEYVTRSRLNYELMRSVNVEVDLEANTTYTILIKVDAHKTNRRSVERVIRKNAHRKQKLTQIGMSYDLAHRKALPLTADGKSCPTAAKPATKVADSEKSDASDDKKDPELDPYSDACCVLGLRVFSQSADLAVSIKVPPTSEVDPECVENEVCEPIILDGDDPAKAAHDQATAAIDTVTEANGPMDHNQDPDEGKDAVAAVFDEWKEVDAVLSDALQPKHDHCQTCGRIATVSDRQEISWDLAESDMRTNEQGHSEPASTSSADAQTTSTLREEVPKQSKVEQEVAATEHPWPVEPRPTTTPTASQDTQVRQDSAKPGSCDSSPEPITTTTLVLDYSQS